VNDCSTDNSLEIALKYPKNNFLQNIFSIRNNNRKTQKIITFMGLKLKIKKVK
jgi:glycosyltransferase involved in cell wall biosynthesis